MFMAAAARHLVTMHSTMTRGEWAPQGGMELSGKTLAVIGSGRIGAATARIAKGFSMRVVGCRRSAVEGDAPPAERRSTRSRLTSPERSATRISSSSSFREPREPSLSGS